MGSTSSAIATYAILAAIQRGIAFLILPFITHAMSPTDYGAASILAAGSMVLTTLLANPLTNLISRTAARDEEDGPALLRLMGLYCYAFMPLFTALIGAVVAAFVPNILGVSGHIWAIELIAVGLQPSASTFALWVAQARGEPRRFAAITVATVLTSVASKILFVIVLHQGVLGWVISDLVSAIVGATLAMILVRLPRAEVTRQNARDVLTFTLPLVPHHVSFWALSFLSRPAMALVTPLQQVGLYSFALNLAQLAGLILTEANRGVLMRYAKEEFPAPSDEMVRIVKWQLIAALLVPTSVGCGVALLGPRLFAESYWPAFGITGILLGAQVAIGLYPIPMNFLTQSAGITRSSSVASGAGAAVLIGGIFLFAPRYGATAVAYATTAAYFTMAGGALGLVALHKLDIAWRSWAAAWPAVALATVALGLTVAALRLPANAHQVLEYVLAALVFDCLAIAALKIKGPKQSLRTSQAG